MIKILTFSRICFFVAVSVIFATGSARSQSYTYEPDSVTFNPNGADSAIGYVRISYNKDTTWPGTNIHCWISDGSTYFSCPTDTVHDSTYIYIRIVYRTASDTVRGQLTISDDTTTKTVPLIGYPNPPPPAFTLDGPYFPSVPEGYDTCVTMWIFNRNSTPDTIRGVSWSHNPNGIFTWDSTSLPYVLGGGDTAKWTFCFHAPDNTNTYTDSIVIYYGSNQSHISRAVSGAATSSLSLEGPYFPSDIPYGGDTCASMRIVNNSSSADTIENVSWAHNSNGIFTWDSTSLPVVLGAHDTMNLTFCFHAPDNTETNIDSIELSYHSSNGNGNVTRVVEAAAAAPPEDIGLLGPYFPENLPEGTDTCVTMRLTNPSSTTDTIESVTWSHNSNGIFVWDTTSLPVTLGAHDTSYFTFCWHAPDNTETNLDTVTVAYRNGSSLLSLSRIVEATATDTTPPDGELTSVGPYFPEVVDEGHDTCTTMRLVNTGSDLDTIVSAGWTHDPQGVFSWQSVSLPATLGAHDTTYWTFCYDAPDDTNMRIDTFMIHYHDEYSQDRYDMRIVEATATDPSIVTCYALYVSPNPAAGYTNVGDTAYMRLYVANRLSDSATLTSLHFSGSDDGSFHVDTVGMLPRAIPPNGYDSLWVLFIPNRTTGDQEYTATLTANLTTADTAHCRETTIAVSGYMPQACTDTETVDFDTTGMDDVSVYGDSTRYYAHRVDFVNNTNSTVIITNDGWTHSSDHFLITETVPSLPDTLAPDDTCAIIFHFYGDSTGNIYRDTIALTIQNGITIHSKNFYPMEGGTGTFLIAINGYNTENPAAGVTVEPIAPSLELELYPNPSSGLVTMQLDGSQSATFEVIDLLGKVLATHSGTGTWQWDPDAIGLADGTYFVRASDGTSVATKRLVIQK